MTTATQTRQMEQAEQEVARRLRAAQDAWARLVDPEYGRFDFLPGWNALLWEGRQAHLQAGEALADYARDCRAHLVKLNAMTDAELDAYIADCRSQMTPEDLAKNDAERPARKAKLIGTLTRSQ